MGLGNDAVESRHDRRLGVVWSKTKRRLLRCGSVLQFPGTRLTTRQSFFIYFIYFLLHKFTTPGAKIFWELPIKKRHVAVFNVILLTIRILFYIFTLIKFNLAHMNSFD